MKRAVWVLGLVLAGWEGWGASLLINPGMEHADPGGGASNWWYHGAAGRVDWANRKAEWGSWGNAFFSAGNAYGGFGQNVAVDWTRGQVFRFDISGKAEANYINTNTTIGLEFWAGGTLRYAVTQNVYLALAAARDTWVFLTLTHTNADPLVDTVRVRCDFADGVIPGGTPSATCQWDDGRFYQMQQREPSAPKRGKFEPVSGVYLGVLLERGGTSNQIVEFNQKAGKAHAVYAKFLLFQQDPFPWEWVNAVTSTHPGAALHFILEPMVGFTNFYQPDWGPGQATYEAALEFITNCAAVKSPIFLRFAHEANGDWYPWHPQFSVRYGIPDDVSNETYITAFRHFASLVHSNAPNVAMVWAPNQGNGPDPMPFYKDVYPGDEYVDWVGLSIYNGWSYGNSNEVLDFQFRNAVQRGYWQHNEDPYDDTFEDFYWTFSDPDNPLGHHKPMMIAETAAAFEPKYAVSNEIVIAGFESLDGPNYTAGHVLCQFQSLNSDGFSASGHTWVEGFDVPGTWNWGPWGTNGFSWTSAGGGTEGTGAVVMSGSPEAGGVYVGGNGRVVGSVPFEPALTIAQFQDLNSDGLVSSNHQWMDAFEVPALWNWGPWTDLYWTQTANAFQGTNAVILGAKDTFASGVYVGGNGRNTFGDGSQQPVRRLAEFQSLHTNVPTREQDWWPAGPDCVPWGDASDTNGGWHTWAITNDPYATYPTNALVMSGTDANTNGYIGGNGFSADGLDADWSEATHLCLVARRGHDGRSNPVLRIEVNDGAFRTARVDTVVSTPVYSWMIVAVTGMTADAGFAWSNVTQVKLHLVAETHGAATSDLYLKLFELGHQTVGTDLTAFNGMVIWTRRLGVTNTDPRVVFGLRSPLGTATVSRVITGTSFHPQKIRFADMTASPGFSFANVTAYTIELFTTADGQAPDPVCVDKWYAANIAEAPYKDQDWGEAGPVHTPWGDAADTQGGWHAWALVEDPCPGYPPLALRLSGTDRNTNSYVGGNGCHLRPGYRDGSVGSHVAWVARSEGDTNRADPLVRLELLDGGGRTASVSEVVVDASYSRLLLARTNMAADPGFVWTNVEQVKLHFLTAAAGVDPNDIYIKELQVGDAPHTTPRDWSGFNGMEIWVKRADDTNAYPILSVSVRSVTTDTNYVAEIQRVVTGTAWYPLRWRFEDMRVTSGFQWTNIQAMVISLLSSVSNTAPSPLYVDRWSLIALGEAPYRDQDWWPPGPHDACWGDETDTNGGWMVWDLVEDPWGSYPSNALRLSGLDANTNYYIGGNGFSLRREDADWSGATYLSLVARRSDATNAEPWLALSLVDGSLVRTARLTVVVVATNYQDVALPLSDMTADPGFAWTNVSSVKFELLSGTPGVRCSDLYLKEFSIGTASNANEQDWWPAGTGYQPWGDCAWTPSADAAVGRYALRISGLITNETQWYIGGNGCAMPISQQDWSSSGALVLYAKRGDVEGLVQPKFKITVDNDYAETNGNEAVIETKVANMPWYEMVIPFADFIADPAFTWSRVKMLKIELFTGEGGRQPNDLYLDHLRRADITLTNGADNLKWKRDWYDQLYALENFEDGDPADPDESPDYASLLERFRNIHMINWFHIKKFEDGFTKDLRIVEDGEGEEPAYASYYERIQDPYFLSEIETDSDGDGLSDAWELAYFGGTTNASAGEDSDHDGHSNAEEFLAGTDPRDDASVLRMATARAGADSTNGFVVRWASSRDRVYALERSTNLLHGFSVLEPAIVATPPTNTYTDARAGPTTRFYRVGVKP